MRIFGKAAVAAAAAGIAVAGTLVAGAGVAHAATKQSVTGCELTAGVLVAGLTPQCTAGDSTVSSPTSITVTAIPAFFTVLGSSTISGLLGGLGLLQETVSYTLNCSVNGGIVSKSESFTATTTASSQSQTVDLQSAAGSPVPNNCTISGLTATSQLSLSAGLLSTLQALGLLPNLTFGVQVTANTAVPGAIWMSAAKTSSGLSADICADDAGNGNAGAIVQAYQCNSDLAQYWVQASTGQLVRNGVCVTQIGSKVSLAKCSGTNVAQQWTVQGTGGRIGHIVNKSSGQCLTAPSPKNFVQLTATACKSGAANQKWSGPGKSQK